MSKVIELNFSTGKTDSLVPAFSASSIISSLEPSNLDPSLILAAERGFVIAPVLTHSRFASARAYVGGLLDGMESIAQAAGRYARCNWTLHIGASALVVLEVDLRIGYQSLAMLCRHSFGRWTKTLQFRDDTSRFFLFRSTGTRVRFLGQRFSGVRTHSGNAFLFVPPSWFVSGRLIWVNQGPILDVPDWLLDPSSDPGAADEVLPLDIDQVPSEGCIE